MLLAAYVRVDGAAFWHISPDEINHVEMAQGETVGDVLRYSLFETHPPLGNLIRHYTMISEAPWFLRGLSLLFGLALIPLFYLIGALLAGPWAGLSTAVLATFSHGCILQSYVVRNYSIFLFFLTCSLYAYFLWRQKRSVSMLLLYGTIGLLAMLTHFSGLFAVGCIALLEALLLLRAKNYRLLTRWLLVNLLITAIALAVMQHWLALLAFTRMQMHALTGTPHDWYYPTMVMDYLFAYRPDAIYCFILSILILYAIGVSAQRIPAARIAAALALLTWAAGAVLVISGAYQAGLTRTSLWLFPFIALPVGTALGLACARLAAALPQGAVAVLLVLLGYSSYSPELRYKDANEYMITEGEWGQLHQYVSAFNAGHLIIASRSDAFLITYPGPNLYYHYQIPRFDDTGVFVHAGLTAVLPYAQAMLLFKPFYFNYSESDLIGIVKEAQGLGLLEHVDTLAFISTLWSRNTTFNLIQCDALDKKVTFFPPLPASHALTGSELKTLHTAVLEVPKQAFLDELANPDGKARQCLKGPPGSS